MNNKKRLTKLSKAEIQAVQNLKKRFTLNELLDFINSKISEDNKISFATFARFHSNFEASPKTYKALIESGVFPDPTKDLEIQEDKDEDK